MTIKINNIEGKELLNFSADYVGKGTIAKILDAERWEIEPDISISECDGQLFSMLYWRIARKDGKSILLSFDNNHLDFYTVCLFKTNEERDEPEIVIAESWEQVMEWGR